MLYTDLPEELRAELEEKKVAMGRMSSAVDAPKQFDDVILVDNDSPLIEGLEGKGYVKTDVSNWYGFVAEPFIGDNEKCLELVHNALMEAETPSEEAEEIEVE